MPSGGGSGRRPSSSTPSSTASMQSDTMIPLGGLSRSSSQTSIHSVSPFDQSPTLQHYQVPPNYIQQPQMGSYNNPMHIAPPTNLFIAPGSSGSSSRTSTSASYHQQIYHHGYAMGITMESMANSFSAYNTTISRYTQLVTFFNEDKKKLLRMVNGKFTCKMNF